MKIALLQSNSGADIAENIAMVEKMVSSAAGAGAQFIASPENTFLMQEPGGERSSYTQDTHPGVLEAQGWAKQYGVWILIGSVHLSPHRGETERGASLRSGNHTSSEQASPHPNPPPMGEGKSYNRSLLINPRGGISAAYDKIHLFDVDVPGDRSYRESDRMLSGAKLSLASLSTKHEAPSTTLGLTICYDVRFPQLYRALAKAGANILAVPAAFTAVTGEAHWHVLLRARAIENTCFVIAPAQCGTHPGNRKTFGHSLVIDPWGRVLADGGTEPGIIYADIDLSEVQKVRSRLPSLEHDREFS